MYQLGCNQGHFDTNNNQGSAVWLDFGGQMTDNNHTKLAFG